MKTLIHPCCHALSIGLAVVLLLTGITSAQAQQNAPRIGYVYPAGGCQGSTYTVTIGGRYLDGVTNAYVSGNGIQARVTEYNKPLNPNQLNTLREKLKELQDRKAFLRTNAARAPVLGSVPATNAVWTAEDDRRIREIRQQLALAPKRQANPAIAELVKLQINLAADAESGTRELRLGTPNGLSNPLFMQVGQLPEVCEKEEPSDRDGRGNPQVPRPGRPPIPRTAIPREELKFTLPATLNGQILPGDVDRYRFMAHKGQSIVLAVSARELIPYLPDAVPGWFQATLALYDSQGKEMAYNDDFRFHPDPVVHFVIPQDGEYVVEIKDAVYRGREDFVYRIAVGELPFITSAFPLGGRLGVSTRVLFKGWNLPTNQLTTTGGVTGVQRLSVRQKDLGSNFVPFAVDPWPEVEEQEPNQSQAGAQPLTLPVVVNGRIAEVGDLDVFRFVGRAGQEVVAEVRARRLDSPLDSSLQLTDATGRPLAFNDDYEDKGSGFNTHHADSWLHATLPADGAYYVSLSDAQQKGGAEYAYRLRLSDPMPDYELRLVPSSLGLRAGANVPMTVYALRRDGFTGEINLSLMEAPPGFTLSGGRVPANQDQIRLTLGAPSTPLTNPVNLVVIGRASIPGQEVSRVAVPAEDMMQAFAYRHLVPSQEFKVAVLGRSGTRTPVPILSPTPLKIPVGGTARVVVGLPAARFGDKSQFELSDAPEGIVIEEVAPARNGTAILLRGESDKVKAGLAGNLILHVLPARPPEATPDRRPTSPRRGPLMTLPAIPFDVVVQKSP